MLQAENLVVQGGGIYEFLSETGVDYVFTGVVRSSGGEELFYDFVRSGSRSENVPYFRWSREKVLMFFIVRFRGIANDLVNGRERTDLIPKFEGLRNNFVQATNSLFYARFADEMEAVLKGMPNDISKGDPRKCHQYIRI